MPVVPFRIRRCLRLSERSGLGPGGNSTPDFIVFPFTFGDHAEIGVMTSPNRLPREHEPRMTSDHWLPANPRGTERFLFAPEINFGDASYSAREVVDTLEAFLADERSSRLDEIIARRTFDTCIVLDQVHDTGNQNAVMRSTEAFGIGSLHLINNASNQKNSRRITRGAEKWLEMEHWNSPEDCVAVLIERGYRIAVTTLETTTSIHDADLTQPTALVFGNEHEGVSKPILARADLRFRYPMQGFSQSLNLSVAAALCMAETVRQRIRNTGRCGTLSAEQQFILKAHYLCRAIKNSDRILNKACGVRKAPGHDVNDGALR